MRFASQSKASDSPDYLELYRQQKNANFRYALAAWALVLGALAVAITVYASVHNFIGVPFQDEWSVIQELNRNHGSYSLSQLWALHNEHRVPYARLLIMADLFWFKGQNISLYLELFVLQIAHFFTIVWALRRLALWPRWMVVIGGGLAMMALFWVSQWESFENPFAITVLAAYLSASFAIFALLFALKTPGRYSGWLGASIAAVFLCEGNLAGGLLLWPLLLVLAVRLRLGAKPILTFGAWAAFFTLLYLYGYRRPEFHANPWESLQHPLLVVEYLLIYFGSSWTGLSLSASQVLAGAGLIAAPACYLLELFRGKVRPFALAVLTLSLFLLGTGFVTALGRIIFPLEQAASSRYQTSALLFWLSLALYAMDAASRDRARWTNFAVVAILVLATGLLPSYSSSLSDANDMANLVKGGAVPVLADVEDDQESRIVFPSPAVIFEQRQFLRERNTAFYASPIYRRLGKALTSQFQVAPLNRCFGDFDRGRQAAGSPFPGWELFGWAWDHQAMKPVEELVAVTDNGTISGLGVSGRPRPDVHNVFGEVSNPDIGWRVYVQGAGNLSAVKVYGVVDGGKSVCLVTPPFAVPKQP